MTDPRKPKVMHTVEPIPVALLAPGMLELSLIHDLSQDLMEQIIAGMRYVDQDRQRTTLAEPPLWIELRSWDRFLPSGEIREAWGQLLLALRTLHDISCPILADVTGEQH